MLIFVMTVKTQHGTVYTGLVCALDYYNNRETEKPTAALSCQASPKHADVCLQACWVCGCVHVASRNDRHTQGVGAGGQE